MNSHNFTSLLHHPQNIDPQKTEALSSIIQKYPYFQSARALYLKGLKQEESRDYNQALKTTAAYTTDRSILFDFITSDAFVQNEISKIIKQNSIYLNDINVSADDISINKGQQIDDKLKEQIKETTGVLDPELFQPKDPSEVRTINFKLDESESIEATTEKTITEEVSAEDILNLGKPLQFDRRESHSFNEWLKLTRIKPIKRSSNPENLISREGTSNETDDKLKQSEIIDKFIAENPKISPVKTTASKENLAKVRSAPPETLMTETLARIYLEQKNYKKAIQSYKILSLKYPEKSSFFANQIKAIEQLQEQNK
ncbi:hypothetical protein EYD45_11420 [Hyunsoonleella flava]|uniref:Tetratricopeptide repeat protein n=1 Tax=Hyunsoonleella flava TaxID=2527939 RepID=A0A4Q9FDJ7_9FLAO|nr:hypothetical protein [Hyunsoonleella flava]TBN02728.1 hypothetical protein EYD45_11420 [Hyunsoonleella flava]